MKVGIYQESRGPGLGGSEWVTAVMANILRDAHDVEIVHHRPDFTIPQLENFSELNLQDVITRYVEPPQGHPIYSGRYLHRARSYWRQWDAEVSAPYDLLIASVHGVPPYCHAPKGMLQVLFPMFPKSLDWPWGLPSKSRFSRMIDKIRKPIYEAGWKERMGTYQSHLCNSKYTAHWTDKYWGIQPLVLYPPVTMGSAHRIKANTILSLGRFTRVKQQDQLLATFVSRISPNAPAWELVFVGSLSKTREDQLYFEELQKTASGHPVRFVVDASKKELLLELERTTIYWHAMGLGVDPLREPQNIEHFGIAPVEAMSAGCVPVVLNKGGPAEIVINNECGYTCSTLEEMGDKILCLTRDARLCSQLSHAAIIRSKEFSVDRFRARFLEYLRPLL